MDDNRTLEDRSFPSYDDDEDYGGCFTCGGAGGWHDCGEDACCCLDETEAYDWVICPDCDGASGL